MSDLISREEAIEALRRAEALTRAFGYHNVIDTIRELPSAVKHGTWTRVGDNSYKCSECGEVSCCFAHYCPDCGARMWERA